MAHQHIETPTRSRWSCNPTACVLSTKHTQITPQPPHHTKVPCPLECPPPQETRYDYVHLCSITTPALTSTTFTQVRPGTETHSHSCTNHQASHCTPKELQILCHNGAPTTPHPLQPNNMAQADTLPTLCAIKATQYKLSATDH